MRLLFLGIFSAGAQHVTDNERKKKRKGDKFPGDLRRVLEGQTPLFENGNRLVHVFFPGHYKKPQYTEMGNQQLKPVCDVAALMKYIEVSQSGDLVYAHLISHNVKILTTTFLRDGVTYLYTFDEQPEGIRKCALYVLLKQLLTESIITNDTTIIVDNTSDESFYTQIGFKLGDPKVGYSIHLYNTVGKLIDTLKQHCSIKNEPQEMKRTSEYCDGRLRTQWNESRGCLQCVSTSEEHLIKRLRTIQTVFKGILSSQGNMETKIKRIENIYEKIEEELRLAKQGYGEPH